MVAERAQSERLTQLPLSRRDYSASRARSAQLSPVSFASASSRAIRSGDGRVRVAIRRQFRSWGAFIFTDLSAHAIRQAKPFSVTRHRPNLSKAM